MCGWEEFVVFDNFVIEVCEQIVLFNGSDSFMSLVNNIYNNYNNIRNNNNEIDEKEFENGNWLLF